MESAEINCKEILKYIGNCSTKVVEKEDIRANYYSFLNDTIYISTMKTKPVEKVNKSIKELLVMCHESIHSIQNKKVQIFNFVFANLDLICFVFLILLNVKIKLNIYLTLSYLFVVLISAVVRGYLEVNAVKRSVELSRELINKGIIKNEGLENFEKIVSKINKVLPFEILRLNIFKVIRIAILFAI